MKRIIYILLAIFACIQSSANASNLEKLYYKDSVLVLTYHDIQDKLDANKQNQSAITVKQFREHLAMLRDRGFQVITMTTFVEYMLHRKTVPANAVLITFDDGYESFYTRAYPVLRSFGMTASNFVVGISSDLFDPEAEPHMNWSQMRELKERGMGIYNHTYDLHRFAAVDNLGTEAPVVTKRLYLKHKNRHETEVEYKRRISSDIRFMEKRLEQELGNQPKLLAFPYGAYNEAVKEVGQQAGIQLFFTVEEGMNKAGSRIVRRINAGNASITEDKLWDKMKKYYEKSANH